MDVRCPACGGSFRDDARRLEGAFRWATAGHAAVVLGCGRCGLLFLPEPAPTVAPARNDAQERAEPAARYANVAQLGQGGMGSAFLAHDRITGRRVCIKRLHGGLDVRVLEQEWRALRKVEHPCLVRLLDFFEAGGRPHLVMDYIPGMGLDAYSRARGALPEPAALDVAAQVLDGIAAAHAANVIHRDLKPGNVVIDWRGTSAHATVVDFGLAIVDRFDFKGAETAVGHPAGTAHYMAPEQVEGRMLTPACDVYAAGLMLAELVVGSFPLKAQTFMDLYREKKALAEGVTVRGESCTADVAVLVGELTRADPARRPSGSQALQSVRALVPKVSGEEALAAVNLDFDVAAIDGRPMGWSDSRRYVTGVSTSYDARVVDGAEKGGGRCLEITGSTGPVISFGSLMQRLPIGALTGAKLTLQADVRTARLTEGVSLWVRADDADGRMLHFDNMRERALKGSVDWTPLRLEAPCLPGADRLNFGILFSGPGQAWVDHVSLVAQRADGVRVALHMDPVAAPPGPGRPPLGTSE